MHVTQASSCLALALSVLLSSLAHLSSSLSCIFFFSGFHPNYILPDYQCSISFSWSSVSDDLFFSSCSFFGFPSCSSFSHLILSLSFLCSSVYEALFALSFSFLSERFSSVHAKAALAYSRNEIIRVSQVSFNCPNLTLRCTCLGHVIPPTHFGICNFCRQTDIATYRHIYIMQNLD